MPHPTLRARFGATAAIASLALVVSGVAASPVTAAAGPAGSPAATSGAVTPAAHHHHVSHHPNAKRQYEHKVRAVVRVVRNQRGKPYVYGGAGPRAFDCSGLVRFVFGKAVGRWLPHNAEAQYQSIHHIAHRRNLRRGDLVFQESGGYAFHVGIYAGHDRWWHAPHSGAHVRKQRIYHGHLYYGRVVLVRQH